MPLDDIVRVWQNALRLRADPAKRYLHDATRKTLDAISVEWQRRHLSALNSDDYFKWPTTAVEGGDGSLMGGHWPATGLLKFMGYAVGDTAGRPESMRRAILAEIFIAHLPPLVSPAYVAEWGPPKSAGRLKKMAETIAALARNAKRRREASLVAAVRDWEDDLGFLYHHYYVQHFHFGWPSAAL